MDKEEDEELWIRLKLDPDEDQPIYNYFVRIKEHLGLKVNTETARYCIKKTHEALFSDEQENR